MANKQENNTSETLPKDTSFNSESFLAKVKQIRDLFEKNEPGRFDTQSTTPGTSR